jgi:hypothetical protein
MVILLWLAFAIVCAIVASNKGYNGLLWFILGIPFGVFALIVICCMPSRKPIAVLPVAYQPPPLPQYQQQPPVAPPQVEEGPRKICHSCRSYIPFNALVCHVCRRQV